MAIRTQRSPLKVTAISSGSQSRLRTTGGSDGVEWSADEISASKDPENSPLFLQACTSLAADHIMPVILTPSDLRNVLLLLKIRPRALIKRGLAPRGSLQSAWQAAVEEDAPEVPTPHSSTPPPSRRSTDEVLDSFGDGNTLGGALGSKIATVFEDAAGVLLPGPQALRLMRLLGFGPRRLVRLELLPAEDFRELCRNQRNFTRNRGRGRGGGGRGWGRGRHGRGRARGFLFGYSHPEHPVEDLGPFAGELLEGPAGSILTLLSVQETRVDLDDSSVSLRPPSVLAPSQPFKVTWIVINEGREPWPDNLDMVCEEKGAQWMKLGPRNAPAADRGMPVVGGVLPGERVHIIRHFAAPTAPGNYCLNFRLRMVNGSKIGQPFPLSFTVAG
jgi:hypothetical protein